MGGALWCVACSYAYAMPISFASLHAAPKIDIPIGSDPNADPTGTVIFG